MQIKEPRSQDGRRASECERLLTDFYGEFRTIARRVLSRNGTPITLQPTDLVHEAALRLIANHGLQINDEAHFLALGVNVMRATLIDEIRRRTAAKRDGGVSMSWDDGDDSFDVEQFDRILDRLATFEPEGAKIVELRFYVGLTMDEIARVLAISERTVHRRWRSARAWLSQELQAA